VPAGGREQVGGEFEPGEERVEVALELARGVEGGGGDLLPGAAVEAAHAEQAAVERVGDALDGVLEDVEESEVFFETLGVEGLEGEGFGEAALEPVGDSAERGARGVAEDGGDVLCAGAQACDAFSEVFDLGGAVAVAVEERAFLFEHGVCYVDYLLALRVTAKFHIIMIAPRRALVNR